MICTEKFTVNGTEYTRTWSDTHMMIERDGVLYEEAIDPADSGRAYMETDHPITDVKAEEADYLEALSDLGVDV